MTRWKERYQMNSNDSPENSGKNTTVTSNGLPIKKPSVSIIKLEKEDLSAYARQYVNKSDLLYQLASNITPIDGFEDFLIHGQPDVVEYESTNGQWIQLTPEEFAKTIKNDPEYNGGNVRLLACKSGMLDNVMDLPSSLRIS